MQSDLPCRMHQLIDPAQDLQGLLIKYPSGFGQPQGAVIAQQQCDAQLLFQQLDLSAKRGLGHVQALRSPSEVAGFGNGYKIFELT